MQYVLNQTQRYWLLLNAFAYVFSLCIATKFGVAKIETLNQSRIYSDFDLGFQEF
jgi:hypothetical protein